MITETFQENNTAYLTCKFKYISTLNRRFAVPRFYLIIKINSTVYVTFWVIREEQLPNCIGNISSLFFDMRLKAQIVY